MDQVPAVHLWLCIVKNWKNMLPKTLPVKLSLAPAGPKPDFNVPDPDSAGRLQIHRMHHSIHKNH